MTTLKNDEGLRRASNLMALSLASYREGSVDTAFDLFIEACEVRVSDDTSAASRELSSLIADALSGAVEGDDQPTTEDALSVFDGEEVLADSDLLGDDPPLGEPARSELSYDEVTANLAELDAA